MKLRSTCRRNRQLVAFDILHVECYKLPVASTCRTLLRHVAGVDGAYSLHMDINDVIVGRVNHV